MSHCTKFNFQFTDEKLIKSSFATLGLSCEKDKVASYYSSYHKSIGDYNAVYDAICAEKNGFNYFMEKHGNRYKLFIEKHDMTYSEEQIAKAMAEEFRKVYIGEAAKEAAKNMEKQGQQTIVEETPEGYQIRFGLLYDKSILIKFENGRVIETVKGVKGQSCVSLTEALENMMSSQNVELKSEWTEEYYEDPGDELTIYNMDQI